MEEKLIEKILQPANLTMACREVVRNKGVGGVDGMKVNELEEYLHEHRATLTEQIRSRNYHAQAIRGREIPKGGGKMRLLGIPTAIDRFQILGYSFVPIYQKGVKGKYQLVVARKRWKSFKTKLKEVTRTTTPMSFDERIQRLNETSIEL
jgi:hypothetical protein